MTDLNESIRFYESQLEDKVVEEAMKTVMERSSVQEAVDLNRSYMDLLQSRYKEILHAIYSGGGR